MYLGLPKTESGDSVIHCDPKMHCSMVFLLTPPILDIEVNGCGPSQGKPQVPSPPEMQYLFMDDLCFPLK